MGVEGDEENSLSVFLGGQTAGCVAERVPGVGVGGVTFT